jgi:hypothetical protein
MPPDADCRGWTFAAVGEANVPRAPTEAVARDVCVSEPLPRRRGGRYRRVVLAGGAGAANPAAVAAPALSRP